MTVKEFYEWCVEQGAENFTLYFDFVHEYNELEKEDFSIDKEEKAVTLPFENYDY